jgi:predicted type IV restriction endonuclease
MSEAPKAIIELVERFQNNLEFYKSKSYDEADLRQEFLNPFFQALGWDMENKAGYAPPYRDVVYWDRSHFAGPAGIPDYTILTGEKVKSFISATMRSK